MVTVLQDGPGQWVSVSSEHALSQEALSSHRGRASPGDRLRGPAAGGTQGFAAVVRLRCGRQAGTRVRLRGTGLGFAAGQLPTTVASRKTDVFLTCATSLRLAGDFLQEPAGDAVVRGTWPVTCRREPLLQTGRSMRDFCSGCLARTGRTPIWTAGWGCPGDVPPQGADC